MRHPVFARIFPPLIRMMDHGGLAARRAELVRGLTGNVIDVGSGSGATFGHYSDPVAHVLAVEPEPRLRRLAAKTGRAAPVPVTVTGGLAGALPVADAGFDAAVITFLLCSVPDPQAALAEIRRVLRPGGTLCFLEHVRGYSAGVTRTQDLLDATVWPRVAGGCHLGRDAAAAVERAGFAIGRLDRFMFPRVRGPMSFYVSGRAVSPR